MENQNLYCHWDTHNSENVLFNSLNDLDSHLKSHYQQEQIESQEQVACHWDSCHEMINLDEMWSHFKSLHFKDLQTPHVGCDPCDPDEPHSHSNSHVHAHTHDHSDSNTHSHTHSPLYTGHTPPQPHMYIWDTPQAPIPSISDTSSLPSLGFTPIKNELATQPCTCKWESDIGCCDQIFPNSHELNAHIVSEHVSRGCHDYVCRWKGCNRECRPFVQRQKLVRHLQTHAKNWSYKCHICGHLSNDDMSLKQHLRTHSGEKPYICKVCGKCFTAMSSLTVHARVHTGEKPLQCKFPGCNKRFSESSNLNKHMKTHLSRSFGCPTCGRKFCRRDQLQRHLNISHRDRENEAVTSVNENNSTQCSEAQNSAQLPQNRPSVQVQE